MRTATKITFAIAATVVAALVAVAVPAVTAVHHELSTWALFSPTDDASQTRAERTGSNADPGPTKSPTPRNPKQALAWEIGCDDFASVGGYAGAAKPSPRPDMGATEYAAGTVTFGEDGGVETYTVEPGDAPEALGERFCVDWVTLLVANDAWAPGPTIQPGQVLQINP